MWDAVVVAAEADVVFLQLNGPKRGIEFPIAVLAIRIHASNEAHEENDHHDDDGQDDDVKLRPGHYCQGRGRAVVSWGVSHAGLKGR